jgi:tetratricopeptide (TPR) repeat protein
MFNEQIRLISPVFAMIARSHLIWFALTLAAMTGHGMAQTDEYAEVARLLRSGQTAEAISKADQYLSTRPRDPQMRFLKGVALTEQGKSADAITLFTRLTEDFPELPEPYNNLAVLYAGQNQFDKARAALEMAIRTNPSYATAHENLGDVYARLASQAYSRALQLDGGNQGIAPKLNLIREIFSVRPGQARIVAAAPSGGGRAAAGPVAPTAPNAPPPPTAATATNPPASTAPPASSASPAPPRPVADADDDVRAAVLAWAAAWSRRDVGGYLAAYGREFDTPDGKSRKAWEDERRERILGKNKISVRLSDLKIEVNGDKATARFRQDYDADRLSVTSRKTLSLSRVGGRWLIVKESTGG